VDSARTANNGMAYDAARANGIVRIESDEPAEQQVGVELFHEQTFTSNRVEDLKEQRRNKRSGGIEA
jgi:hypothetical protein